MKISFIAAIVSPLRFFIAAAAIGLLVTARAHASSYTLTTLNGNLNSGSWSLGEVIPGDYSAGGQAVVDEQNVNVLVGMYNTSVHSSSGGGNTYTLSGTSFGPSLPGATLTGNIIANGTVGGMSFDGTWAKIVLASTFQYLIGKYDGPNSGAEVWDIGGIAAGSTIYIPQFAKPGSGAQAGELIMTSGAGAKYQMTGWTLFHSDQPNSVPDGGSTALLLGAALSVIGLLRRQAH
ncbi:MAG: VPDSG-CTERM sorting domain-containing protein [Verrucomicrobia bacterium]|nr:VPDSG-CTERM sorting domain-containing protein [Verrucomicrobiota bacterium]